MLQQLPAFLVFQSSAGPLPVQQLTERAGYFRDRQTSIIPCDLPDQLQLLPCKDAPTKTQRNSSPPPRLLGWRRVTRYGHGWIAAEALSISHGRTCQANSTGTVPSPRDGERDRAGSTVSAKAAEERACVRPVGGTSARILLLSGVTNNSISTSREFFPCCWALPRMLLSTAWARAPFAVRFPPQFLRATTSGRRARSAPLLVASKPGQ